MSYEPRTIAFLSELLYPPMQLRSDVVQGIHNNLFRQPEISYQNFTVAQDGIHLANVPVSPGAVSSVTFLPDRMIVREELRGTTVEDFATRLVNVASLAFRALGVQQTLAQQFVVRSLITPTHWQSATEFMARRVLATNDTAWNDLGRPIQSIGMRLMFPQHDQKREVFNLRVETWHQDPRSLWIENIGSFTTPTQTENLPDLSTYLYSTYKFVTSQVCPFLASFDRH